MCICWCFSIDLYGAVVLLEAQRKNYDVRHSPFLTSLNRGTFSCLCIFCMMRSAASLSTSTISILHSCVVSNIFRMVFVHKFIKTGQMDFILFLFVIWGALSLKVTTIDWFQSTTSRT